MLNHINANPDDLALLERSYNAIKQKDNLIIVTDENERESIYRQTADALSIPAKADFSILNLFKLSLPTGQFYIAQCLLDFGYPVTGRNMQSSEHKYDFQLIGIAGLATDLGKTFLRPETRMDKMVGRFLDYDIDFTGQEVFNGKFYLASNNKGRVLKTFDKLFTDTIAKYKNVHLSIKNKEMYIWFARTLEAKQSAIIEDIYSHCTFLARQVI